MSTCPHPGEIPQMSGTAVVRAYTPVRRARSEFHGRSVHSIRVAAQGASCDAGTGSAGAGVLARHPPADVRAALTDPRLAKDAAGLAELIARRGGDGHGGRASARHSTTTCSTRTHPGTPGSAR